MEDQELEEEYTRREALRQARFESEQSEEDEILAAEAEMDDAGEAESEEPSAAVASGLSISSTLVVFFGFAKDVLDWVVDLFGGFGEIPIIGQIPGILMTVFIIYYQWSHGMLRGSLTKKGFSLALSVIDNFPLFFNNLPLSTFATWITRYVKKFIPSQSAKA